MAWLRSPRPTALRANYDNHPAYGREARENDLDAAAASLKKANDLFT